MSDTVAHPIYGYAVTAEGYVSADEEVEEPSEPKNNRTLTLGSVVEQDSTTSSIASALQRRERQKTMVLPQSRQTVSNVAVRQIFSDLEKGGDATDAERKICALLANWERTHATEKAQIALKTQELRQALVDKECLRQMVLELHRLMNIYGGRNKSTPLNADESEKISKLQQEIKRQSDEIASWINSQRSVMTINLKLKGIISDLREELDGANKMNMLLEQDIAGLGEKYNKLVEHCKAKLEEAQAAVVAAEEDAEHERLAAQAKTVKVSSLMSQLKAKEAENAELHSICDRLLMENASVDE